MKVETDAVLVVEQTAEMVLRYHHVRALVTNPLTQKLCGFSIVRF